ncbi:MAG: hypothetical protein ABR512_00870 [Desulfopila sp.]
MNTIEKAFSIFAILFAIGLIAAFWAIPELRQVKLLVPISFFGMVINIVLMFIVLRDILYRRFSTPTKKLIWLGVILLFWPAILYYLPRHGFQPRQ